MDYFELMRNFWDFSFENPEKIKPNHCALYCFIVEHCNRLGWKEKFGLPTTMSKDAIGIRSYNTYIQTLNELESFGFIKLVEKSKNQYSSNIVALLKFNKALDKALDKAFIKHSTKQSESTVQSIDSIIKQDTNIHNTNKQINGECFTFDEFWSLYPKKVAKEICGKKYESLSANDKQKIKETLPNFILHKPFKDYTHPNPSTYLNQKRWNDEIITTVKKEELKFSVNFQHPDSKLMS